ncbi:MAG: VOC family protein [Clostridiales bacterium]|nr:VOC family protein [Clostridiales bacterium]
MKFLWTTISVKSMEESLAFYQDIVGLSISRRFPTGSNGEIVFLGGGETKVELIYDGSGKDVVIGADISLGFEVDCLEEKMDFIKEKGLKVDSGPFQPNPGVKFFFVRDPNGLRIQFVENIV